MFQVEIMKLNIGVLIVSEQTYVDESSELIPFNEYSYRVNVRNGAGLALGPWAVVSTGASRKILLQSFLLYIDYSFFLLSQSY